MLPRYAPALFWPGARSPVTASSPTTALAQVIAALVPGEDRRHARVAPTARQALLAHYSDLAGRVGRRTILLPAQVCPVVPAVIRAAGFETRALDAAGGLATPSPAQYLEAINQPSVVGVLVAPMNGYVQPGWSDLLPQIPETLDVTLDLAQAPFAAQAFDKRFVTRADAILFSFGVGKGFDTGGGLLLTRRALPAPPVRRAAWPTALRASSRSAAIRSVMALGLYRFLLPVVDRLAGEDTAVAPAEALDPASAERWLRRLPTVRAEFARAAERSDVLAGLRGVRTSCTAVESTCSAEAQPLRQLLRLRPGLDRGAILEALRTAGLDCAPAGEPFPAGGAEEWPVARGFAAAAMRLPFLGRYSVDEFVRTQRVLEQVLTSHGV